KICEDFVSNSCIFDYEIWQMDVKTAFLNGDIEEELYMVQPKGFVDPKNADKVCKLQRSIYGLKQASRSWNRRFDKVIKDFGFIQCHGEACIYKKVSGSSVAFLILYVDDILLIGNDIELLSSVKGYLNNSFSMKDLGEASYILGIKIYRDRSRRLIGLSQSTYLDKILKKFRMDESKKGFLPMLPGKVLSKTQGPATEERERMSNIPYASAVGSIMYAMLCTRPDIAHAVSLTSRYQSDPGMEHWTAVKNILKYLKRTKDMFLCYGGDQELVVNGYTDASWNTDPDDSKSQSGYVFILNGAAVSGQARSVHGGEVFNRIEYIAASEASSEAVWMKRFIVDLGVVPSALDPLIIYCDNMGAIANAQEPRSHKRLKHIKLRYHSIREYIEDGEVKICKVHTDLNVADPLTKALPRAKHDQHQNAMGVSMNIISGSCLMQDGYSFKSENNGCSIFMNNIFYGRAPQKNGLFLLDLDSSDTHIHNIDAKRIKLNDNSTYMWHCRLGHIGVKRMKKLHTDGLLESLDFESLDRCEACLMGKMTKTPFSGMMERATDLLEIIHTDVCGPMSVASRGGYRYVLTFTDDLSRYGYIYFMKHKSETFEKFKEFQSEVENQRNKKIKFLRSDRGGEYLSYEFGMHLKKCGILSQLTPPGTPQRNGVSERRNRTLLDMVRSMMSLTDLPLSFWSYALETAAFTLNRAPSKSVETTPYELWFNKKPKLSFLKVWGCEAYVKKLQPDKLEPKAEKCVFIGYPKETIGYTFYHKSEGKIFVAKNGTFLEKEFLTKEVTGRKVELDEIDESILVDQSSAVPEVVPVPPTPTTEEANDNDHETWNEETTEPRRSTRERTTPD
ncbi:hypothetical protein QYE76_007835, partial [Lolium multiflorum]